MENQTMSTNTKWTYTLGGDNQNHHNGRVTDNATGELIALRAVMSPDDAAVMHLIAAAPELLDTLADAEFLMRMLVKHPDDVGSMIDSLKRCAEDARFIISNIAE